MSHQKVSIPLPMKPIAKLSRFLFHRGKGEWVYRSVGGLVSLGDRMGDMNVFKGYTPTEHDIIIACHTRSGTHWMMQIALQIAHLGQAEYDYIYDIVSWPDFLPGAAIDLKKTPPPSPTGKRVIKTHVTAQSLPMNDVSKYIVVIRDPKEVLVSLYHFAPQSFAFLGIQTGTPDYFVQKFVKNQVPGGWWAKHTASWWALRDKPNVHIVTFNDLKANSNGEIDRISEFLNVDLSPEQREQVIEKSSFDYMKAINHKFSPIIGDTGMMEVIRTGKANTNTELFTAEHFAMVDMMCKRELESLDSDFPYDQIFG